MRFLGSLAAPSTYDNCLSSCMADSTSPTDAQPVIDEARSKCLAVCAPSVPAGNLITGAAWGDFSGAKSISPAVLAERLNAPAPSWYTPPREDKKQSFLKEWGPVLLGAGAVTVALIVIMGKRK